MKKKVEKKIDKVNKTMFDSFVEKKRTLAGRERATKKRRLDEVQTGLQIHQQKQSHKLKDPPPTNDKRDHYWVSKDAENLFCPLPEESVVECLLRRDSVLMEAITDDDVLLSLCDTINDLEDITAKARQHLRYKCMYIKKAYEIALQKMNQLTWHECCKLAVEEVNDIGVNYITGWKTIAGWNQQFRSNGLFPVPFV